MCKCNLISSYQHDGRRSSPTSPTIRTANMPEKLKWYRLNVLNDSVKKNSNLIKHKYLPAKKKHKYRIVKHVKEFVR